MIKVKLAKLSYNMRWIQQEKKYTRERRKIKKIHLPKTFVEKDKNFKFSKNREGKIKNPKQMQLKEHHFYIMFSMAQECQCRAITED